MSFVQSKPKRSSITLWGAGAAILAPVAAALGWSFTGADVATIVNTASLAASGLGGVAAWIGRLRARTTVR